MTSDHKKLFEVLHVVGDSSSSARELYTTCRNALLHFGDDDIGLSTMEFNDGIVLNSSDIGAWSSDHDKATPDPIPTNRKKPKSSAFEMDFAAAAAMDSLPKEDSTSEFEFVNGPTWQTAVDPKTYHYLPQNGRYRATKLAKRLHVNSNKSNNRKGFGNQRSSRASRAVLMDLIQKELKSEYDMFLMVEKQRKSLKRIEGARTNNCDLTDEACPLAACDASAATNSQIDFKSTIGDPPISTRRKVPPLNMHHLSQEEGVRYLEQVSSRLRDLQLSLRESSMEADECEDTKQIEHKEDRQVSASSSPVMATIGKQIDMSPLNRNRKLPGIRTEALVEEELELPVKTEESSGKVGKTAEEEKGPRWRGSLFTHNDDDTKLQPSVHTSKPFFFYPPDAMRLRESHKPTKQPSSAQTQPGDSHTTPNYRLSRADESITRDRDLQTLALLDDIRTSYNKVKGVPPRDEDDVSCESRPIGGFRVVTPRGRPPLPGIATRNPDLIFKDWKGRGVKSIPTGSNNNFLRRPRPGLTPPAVLDVLNTVRSRGSSPIGVERRLPHAVTSVRGNMMPEVLVKRAGLTVSSKRII